MKRIKAFIDFGEPWMKVIEIVLRKRNHRYHPKPTQECRRHIEGDLNVFSSPEEVDQFCQMKIETVKRNEYLLLAYQDCLPFKKEKAKI